MFQIAKPTEAQIDAFLESQRDAAYTYKEVGATRTGLAPVGYNIDRNRVKLGVGLPSYDRAVEAVRAWKMFDTGWTLVNPANPPIEEGATVAVAIRHFGFWSLNAARIVYSAKESTDRFTRFGFAYGTLADHGERGEERFVVEIDRTDGSVWYDLFAFSTPNHWMATIGSPLTRHLQKRFAKDSMASMVRAVSAV